MPFVVSDRVQEVSSSPGGTGTINLGGAVPGFVSFATGIGSGNDTYYCIFDQVTNEFEVGTGTYTSGSPNTLSRTTVYDNSLGTTAKINFTNGNTLNVFCTGPATRMIYQDAGGFVGVGTANDGTAILQITGGTTAACALEFNNGTLMTTPDGGSMEFDGNNLSFTNDATSRRGYVPAINIFRLTANGTAIGAAIANFFGANSAISVAAATTYELEAYCYFTKTTAGTVTVTLTSSQTPVNINGTVDYGAAAGGTATGAANRISVFASALAATAFGASASLTTAVNHAFIIRAIIETNATTAGDIRINFTESAGTVTPLRGSYYKLTKLPPGNSGNFVA